MKEHALFLTAGFPSKNIEYVQKAEWFKNQFEELLRDTLKLSCGVLGCDILNSQEIVTDYTLIAERKTSNLTGISIDSCITEAEMRLSFRGRVAETCEMRRSVRRLNETALCLIRGLIDFKTKVLKEVTCCQLFTFNYPLLIQHIIREAKLYKTMIEELNNKGSLSCQNIWEMEVFWNQIMMEHALFIRGLLDPTEEELIDTADGFAKQYCQLLKESKSKNGRAMDALTLKTIEETEKYRDFKAAGTKGITECKIAGLILPLLADHVLREANHYLRILETGQN